MGQTRFQVANGLSARWFKIPPPFFRRGASVPSAWIEDIWCRKMAVGLVVSVYCS